MLTETRWPRWMQRMLRRLALAWNVWLPKRACRRLRIYGAICRMNGRLRAGLSEAELCWWHRNSGRLLTLNAKWFGHADGVKPPNAEVSEGGTRDSRIETAAQSRPSPH